jgi:hypothetical protein
MTFTDRVLSKIRASRFRGSVQDEVREKNMVLCLEDAITILSKWKDDSADILVVSESPFQQSRRGILEHDIDWSIGLQGRVSNVSVDPSTKGKRAGTIVFETPGGSLSLAVGGCVFVYEEPREAKPVVREEAESTTVSALSVFFPSNEVFVFYELREPSLKAGIPGWSTI